jgi:hypothetical protein
MLQTASGETLPILKVALVELTLGRSPIRIWALVAEITEELILRPDILHTYVVFMGLRRHMLRLGEENLSLWSPRAEPRSFRHVVTNDNVIPARFGEW